MKIVPKLLPNWYHYNHSNFRLAIRLFNNTQVNSTSEGIRHTKLTERLAVFSKMGRRLRYTS